MTEQNNGKYEKLDKIIRHHYFDDKCEHENYNACCAYILNLVMNEIGYKVKGDVEVEA